MQVAQLRQHRGLLFVTLEDGDWMIDTGCPYTYSPAGRIAIDGVEREIRRDFGVPVSRIAEETGQPVCGMLGSDVLGTHDVIFDAPHAQITFSRDTLRMDGALAPLRRSGHGESCSVRLGGIELTLFVDTGSELTFINHAALEQYPDQGAFEDFSPFFGAFTVQTHRAPVEIAGRTETLRCGRLPPAMAGPLLQDGADGVLGSEILLGRRAGYFARRGALFLG